MVKSGRYSDLSVMVIGADLKALACQSERLHDQADRLFVL
jgi:hypothetical protein